MHTANSHDNNATVMDTSPNLDLVPCVDDKLVIGGVLLVATYSTNVSMSSL
ncbi:hypothetical protein PC128_g13561 [Phytophthora cactorum]|nr:hypothetical protein PC120_g10975 [Phytophthora cactorum]KAG3184903.1 hypothetical protein PC128_g13561 [Phytophthora cactorum]KAG4053425.1 hypothetical protein PC123_g11434 [Phytophthora cactorum]